MTGQVFNSVCPHDCPSACALSIELDGEGRLSSVKGDAEQPYTSGVICSKVARYADRLYHPDRILTPLKRDGAKGSGSFTPISWDEALDTVAEKLRQASDTFTAESVWPYHYAGTMGILQRGILDAFRHAGGYSRQDGTICSRIGSVGWNAGIGGLSGSDPREIANTELLVLWGTNAAATQINVMAHYTTARKAQNAKLVVIDPYHNDTAKRADVFLPLKPGTDAALACAVMHVLLQEDLIYRDFLASRTDFDDSFVRHIQQRGPQWAAHITGLSVQQITDFALLYGRTEKAYIRLGVGLSRQRNGAVATHAISCLPTLKGAWSKRGSGALYMSSDVFRLDKSYIAGVQGESQDTPQTRILDMCQIGAVLNGDAVALKNGPPVQAMIVQNCNPAVVAPNLAKVHQGFKRDDLFLCVHEQFMTDTARFADIVLPATMFLEHDDLYSSYGHSFLQLGAQVLPAAGECRSNHTVLAALAERLGFSSEVLQQNSEAVIDKTLRDSGYDGFSALKLQRFMDMNTSGQPDTLADGFAWPDKRFRFKPDWAAMGPNAEGMPSMPDHWDVIETPDADYPYRLITPTAKNFLNTSFNNIALYRKRAGKPTLMMNPEDAARGDLQNDSIVRVVSRNGEVRIHLEISDKVPSGTVVSEGLWSSSDHLDGLGINALVSDQAAAPDGGAVFHDTAVRVELAASSC